MGKKQSTLKMAGDDGSTMEPTSPNQLKQRKSALRFLKNFEAKKLLRKKVKCESEDCREE